MIHKSNLPLIRLREVQQNKLNTFRPHPHENRQIFIDMFGDFHTQFAYMKAIFRNYWANPNVLGLSQICTRLKRKSIKKECKVYFDGEELLLHTFQGYIIAHATKILQTRRATNSKAYGPSDVFEIAREICEELRLNDVTSTPFNRKDHFITNAKDIAKILISDIVVFFYFKKVIRASDGYGVLRSLKILFIKFLGSLFYYF
jgi:hypothetical protein